MALGVTTGVLVMIGLLAMAAGISGEVLGLLALASGVAGAVVGLMASAVEVAAGDAVGLLALKEGAMAGSFA